MLTTQPASLRVPLLLCRRLCMPMAGQHTMSAALPPHLTQHTPVMPCASLHPSAVQKYSMYMLLVLQLR